MEQKYICKYCGKECKNANSLRNHERLCKSNPNHQKNPMEGVSPWNKGYTKHNNDTLLMMSINSPHKKKFVPYKCEKCGKLVTAPFGSNRFCSKKCANSHMISEEQKRK